MTNKLNTQGLNDSAQKKRTDTIQRVMDALKLMEQESIPINFLSVFRFTGIARSWLYKEPNVCEFIKNAKGRSNNRLMQDQAVQLKTKDREIDILTKQNKMLRKQIEELRQQLEVAYAALYKQDS
jgi:hypothetical protein